MTNKNRTITCVFAYVLRRWNNDRKPKHFSHASYGVFDNQIVTVCTVYRRTRYMFLNYVGTRKRKNGYFTQTKFENSNAAALYRRKNPFHTNGPKILCVDVSKKVSNNRLHFGVHTSVYIYFFFLSKMGIRIYDSNVQRAYSLSDSRGIYSRKLRSTSCLPASTVRGMTDVTCKTEVERFYTHDFTAHR